MSDVSLHKPSQFEENEVEPISTLYYMNIQPNAYIDHVSKYSNTVGVNSIPDFTSCLSVLKGLGVKQCLIPSNLLQYTVLPAD